MNQTLNPYGPQAISTRPFSPAHESLVVGCRRTRKEGIALNHIQIYAIALSLHLQTRAHYSSARPASVTSTLKDITLWDILELLSEQDRPRTHTSGLIISACGQVALLVCPNGSQGYRPESLPSVRLSALPDKQIWLALGRKLADVQLKEIATTCKRLGIKKLILDDTPVHTQSVPWRPPLIDGLQIVPARYALYEPGGNPLTPTRRETTIRTLFPCLHSWGTWDAHVHE